MTTTMNISLPQSMKTFILNEVEECGFTSPSEFMRGLVRKRQEEQREKQEQKIQSRVEIMYSLLKPMLDNDPRYDSFEFLDNLQYDTSLSEEESMKIAIDEIDLYRSGK